jgi:hypothetical protein
MFLKFDSTLYLSGVIDKEGCQKQLQFLENLIEFVFLSLNTGDDIDKEIMAGKFLLFVE